jgi:hypothetical protein
MVEYPSLDRIWPSIPSNTSGRLKGAGFSEQQAEVLAEATRDLVADEMVTKSFLQSELEKVSMRLTIRMGTIAAVCVAALAAIIKL